MVDVERFGESSQDARRNGILRLLYRRPEIAPLDQVVEQVALSSANELIDAVDSLVTDGLIRLVNDDWLPALKLTPRGVSYAEDHGW